MHAKCCKPEWSDILQSTKKRKQLASGCVSSCRQVDVASNKDTNICQGSKTEKASDRGREREEKGDLSSEETEADRECFSSD